MHLQVSSFGQQFRKIRVKFSAFAYIYCVPQFLSTYSGIYNSKGVLKRFLCPNDLSLL